MKNGKLDLMGGPIGVYFTLHYYKSGEEIRMNIPLHEDWYWGKMPDGSNYVTNSIKSIKLYSNSLISYTFR